MLYVVTISQSVDYFLIASQPIVLSSLCGLLNPAMFSLCLQDESPRLEIFTTSDDEIF